MPRTVGRLNWCGRFFLVLLRVAIGWHLCYEGLTKIKSLSTNQPFSARGYLLNATGPLGPRLRQQADVFDLRKLELENGLVKLRWRGTAARAYEHYGFYADQREKAEQLLQGLLTKLDEYDNPQVLNRIEEFQKAVAQWEGSPAGLLPEERAEHRKRLGELVALQKELVGPIEGWTEDLNRGLEAILSADQLRMPPLEDSWAERLATLRRRDLAAMDLATMYGLVLCGTGLIVGLFTRLSALGAATLLALFYFTMPPWPGLSPNPVAEGDYLIVNKNLIEMLACLTLACSPSGIWAGLDALIRGLITRPLFRVGTDEVVEPVARR